LLFVGLVEEQGLEPEKNYLKEKLRMITCVFVGKNGSSDFPG